MKLYYKGEEIDMDRKSEPFLSDKEIISVKRTIEKHRIKKFGDIYKWIGEEGKRPFYILSVKDSFTQAIVLSVKHPYNTARDIGEMVLNLIEFYNKKCWERCSDEIKHRIYYDLDLK